MSSGASAFVSPFTFIRKKTAKFIVCGIYFGFIRMSAFVRPDCLFCVPILPGLMKAMCMFCALKPRVGYANQFIGTFLRPVLLVSCNSWKLSYSMQMVERYHNLQNHHKLRLVDMDAFDTL